MSSVTTGATAIADCTAAGCVAPDSEPCAIFICEEGKGCVFDTFMDPGTDCQPQISSLCVGGKGACDGVSLPCHCQDGNLVTGDVVLTSTASVMTPPPSTDRTATVPTDDGNQSDTISPSSLSIVTTFSAESLESPMNPSTPPFPISAVSASANAASVVRNGIDDIVVASVESLSSNDVWPAWGIAVATVLAVLLVLVVGGIVCLEIRTNIKEKQVQVQPPQRPPSFLEAPSSAADFNLSIGEYAAPPSEYAAVPAGEREYDIVPSLSGYGEAPNLPSTALKQTFHTPRESAEF
jgi:hypothetical protein